MRLVIIIDYLYTDAAGTEGQVVKLLKGLSDRFEIDLVCLRDTPWLHESRGQLPCNVVSFAFKGVGTPSFWREAGKLKRFLAERRPDVVHTFFPVSNIVGVLCAHFAGVKSVVASRRDYGHWMNGRYLWATRFANRFVSRIVSNSEQVKQLTARTENYPLEQIEVIYNGIELEAFESLPRQDALKATLGIPAHHKVITLVGNIRPIKRHDTLVHAAKAMLTQRSDVSLLFIGKDNGNMAEVRALVEREGLAPHVFWAHANGNVQDYLSFTDIGVNCSESEGLSNAVIECMAAGVPCVVSEGGGNVDLIEQEVNGLVIRVGDHQQLAQALHRMLDDAPLRQRCVAASLRKVQIGMSLPAVLDRFEHFYRQLGSDSARAAPTPSRRVVSPKALARKVVYRLASAPPVLGRLHANVSKRGVTVFMYHEIGADHDDVDAWQVVRRSDFLRQVEHLRRHFQVLSLDQALQQQAFRGTSDKPVAVLTFDDGNRGMVEHLVPILEREALPVAVYVATGHIEQQTSYWFDRVVNALQGAGPTQVDLGAHGLGVHRFERGAPGTKWVQIQALLSAMKRLSPQECDVVAGVVEQQVGRVEQAPPLSPMTIDQVTEMARHPMITLGAHTHGHEVLTLLAPQEAKRSIEQSIELLRQWTGQSVKHFAYPSGFVNDTLEAMMPELGMLTAVAGGAGLWTAQSSLYAIPRIAVGRYDTLDKFKIDTVLGLRAMPGHLMHSPA